MRPQHLTLANSIDKLLTMIGCDAPCGVFHGGHVLLGYTGEAARCPTFELFMSDTPSQMLIQGVMHLEHLQNQQRRYRLIRMSWLANTTFQ